MTIDRAMVERGVEAVYDVTRSNELAGVPDDKRPEVRQLVRAVLTAALDQAETH